MLPIKKTKTAYIAYTAIFTAICFVINYIYIPFGGMFAISFVPTICYLTGILLNPFLALVVGGLSDILGCFAKGYPPNIFILLGSSLWGLIMGLSYKYLKLSRLLKMVIGGVTSVVICSFLLNSYGIYTYATKGTPFLAFALPRLAVQIPNTIVNVAISYVLVRSLEKAIRPKTEE
ncbi:MAG: folate family ECF transporter S component [Clostridia bacterium]